MESLMVEALERIQKEIKELNKKIDTITRKVDTIESVMEDSFKTLELLSKTNGKDINKVKVDVSKLEKIISETNNIN